jgi:hypothetical protein
MVWSAIIHRSENDDDMIESREPQHWLHALFHAVVVLFDHII